MIQIVRTRDVRVDAATGVLITFVVFGHVLETMQGGAAHAAVIWVYTFHMPAFVFLSGYVTRYMSRWSPVSIVTRLLFPYFIFAIIQRVLTAWLDHTPFEFSLRTPPFTLWYLLALMVWRLTVPIVKRLSFWVAVPIAVVISIIGAGVDWLDKDFSGGRIVGFFPFFVAGLLWRAEWWEWALSRPARIVAMVLLVASAVWIVLHEGSLNRGSLVFSQSHTALGFTSLHAMMVRALVLAIGAVLGLSVVVLSMRVMPVLAGIGVASLTVYLLHAIVLFPWHLNGAPDDFAGTWAVLVAAVGSAALAWLLSRPPVVAFTRPIMDLRFWEQRSVRAPQCSHRRVSAC